MILLFDIQSLVWLATGSNRLSRKVVEAMRSVEHEFFVSAVTACEFVDLEQRGRFGIAIDFVDLLSRFEMILLDFPAKAWQVYLSLPDFHRDPVDRMLIAHAIHADLTLVTSDKIMRGYPVKSLW